MRKNEKIYAELKSRMSEEGQSHFKDSVEGISTITEELEKMIGNSYLIAF
jgi:hypothetical protein